MLDPRDVIYAAIHSAFAKDPKKDDPTWTDHWIQPEEGCWNCKPTGFRL